MSSGVCGLWAMKAGDFIAKEFPGTSAGLADAITYCGSNGSIQLYPGNASISVPSLPAGVSVHVHEAGVIRSYGDAREEYTRSGKRRNHYNVMDYASVAAAIAAVPAGAKVYFPSEAGPFIPPDSNGWSLTKPVEIYSDGRGIDESKAFQYFKDGGGVWKDSTIFKINSSHVTIHDAAFSSQVGVSSALGVGDAIGFSSDTPSLGNLCLERLSVFYAGRNGLRLKGGEDPGGVSSQFFNGPVDVRDCLFLGCKGDGAHLDAATFVTMIATSFAQNKRHGLKMVGVGNGFFLQISAESNADDLSDLNYDGQVCLENCRNGQVSGCNFEDFKAATVYNALVLNSCRGVVVQGCEFDGDTGTTRGIHLANGTKCCTIGANVHSDVSNPVEVNDATNEVGNVIHGQRLLGTSGPIILPAGSRNIVYDENAVRQTFMAMTEIADPAAAAANGGRLYVRDNGAGKTQLCVRFATGAVQVIATEP